MKLLMTVAVFIVGSSCAVADYAIQLEAPFRHYDKEFL